jgi:hypothetical protein
MTEELAEELAPSSEIALELEDPPEASKLKKPEEEEYFETWQPPKKNFLVKLRKKISDFRESFGWDLLNFFKWVQKSWEYALFLRNDRDYDWTYILKLLEFKLARTRKCIEQGYHTNAKRDAHNIRVAELLIQRIVKDEYAQKQWNDHDAKWGELEIRFGKSDGFSVPLKFHRERMITEEDEERESRELIRIYEFEDQLKKYDVEYLFTIMRRHLRTWWE